MKKLIFSLIILGGIFFAKESNAATFYVDLSVNPHSTCGNGTATTTPFCTIDAFTEAARTAGDIAWVRRGNATTTHSAVPGDLNFTSDGTRQSPLVIAADYDNLWNDFSTSTQTYTVTPGSNVMTASGSITGIAAGDWIYVYGDQIENFNKPVVAGKDYAYEVDFVSDTTLRLKFPYEGLQTGAGLSLRRMPNAPAWGFPSAAFQWIIGGDNYWSFYGINVAGADTASTILVNGSSINSYFKDMIVQGNGATFRGFDFQTISFVGFIIKSRIFNVVDGIRVNNQGFLSINNIFIDCVSVADSAGYMDNSQDIVIGYFNKFSTNRCTRAIRGDAGSRDHSFVRDVKAYNATNIITQPGIDSYSRIAIEDYNNFPDRNVYGSQASGGLAFNFEIESSTSTSELRSGGGATSIRVTPQTTLSDSWPMQLFEYPIYTDTTSRQYDVYFSATTTGEWTADPVVTDLWIEAEYWNYPAGATSTRVVKKSTSVLDFNGSTAWQTLSVTVQPSRAGLLYIRGWYRKPREANKSNQFLIDGTPVIQ